MDEMTAMTNSDDVQNAQSAAQSKRSKPIKKPLSAWLIFSIEKREILSKEQPHKTFQEISKEVGEHYRSLTEEEKQVFENRAKLDKQRYLREVEETKSDQNFASPRSPEPEKGGGVIIPLVSCPLNYNSIKFWNSAQHI